MCGPSLFCGKMEQTAGINNFNKPTTFLFFKDFVNILS